MFTIKAESGAMDLRNPTSKRHFTDAARAAAIEARRRKRETALPLETPEVYIVRLPGVHLQFGWEVRRFGAIVLDRGGTGYETPGAARSAGLRALAATAVRA